MSDQQPSTVTRVRCGDPGIEDLAVLFDRYRTHYARPSDVVRSRVWIEAGLATGALHAFVAREEGAARGMAIAVSTPASLRLGHFWQLRDLYVDAGHRGRGVGRDLVLEVGRAARADGALRVALTTEEDNAPALRLYSSLGFQSVRGHLALALDLGVDPGRA
jgi:ribosomal protein S18 acetylase RimI-like enzyme